MSQTANELRKAAASARAFADSVESPDLKRSFREMARRWEREADEHEIEDLRKATSGRSGPFVRALISRGHYRAGTVRRPCR
jgi:hypothetical protein